jgi:hypothetical protein
MVDTSPTSLVLNNRYTCLDIVTVFPPRSVPRGKRAQTGCSLRRGAKEESEARIVRGRAQKTNKTRRKAGVVAMATSLGAVINVVLRASIAQSVRKSGYLMVR